MRHDINNKTFCFIFKKNMIINKIVDYCFSEKTVNKGSFFSRRYNVV